MDNQNQEDAQQRPSQSASHLFSTLEDKHQPSSLPTSRHSPQKHGLNGWVYLLEGAEQRSQLLLPMLGYGLLVSALFDYIHIIIPLGFTNPIWELQTIGALVEHAAIPLLGLLFVFYRRQGYIRKSERMLMIFLSWVALLLGLLYLFMLPLGMADTWRLYHAADAQISAQLAQQNHQFQNLKEQLNQAKTDNQLKQVLASLTPPQARSEKVKNPQALKDQLLVVIPQAQRNMQLQADRVAINQKQALIKNSVKWNLGTLLDGTLLILIWHLTNWVRRSRYWSKC